MIDFFAILKFVRTRKKYSNSRIAKAGFTLVELAIVLVIIGLVVGSVIIGKDLIKAAEIRSQVTQIVQYKTAFNSFKLIYNYLPGDLPSAQATQLGFTARSGAKYHGDGDEQIFACGTTLVLGCENVLFWNDLSSANMVDGGFNTATDAAVTASPSTIERYIPKAKLQGQHIIPAYLLSSPYVVRNCNTISISGYSNFSNGNYTDSSNTITPQDAMNIDTKMDDGKPFTGSIWGSPFYAPSAPASGVCVSNATGNPYNTTNSTYANVPSCYVQFKL
jgi:prepilin-type N-terminal cleavage/methylation domain-containing protein